MRATLFRSTSAALCGLLVMVLVSSVAAQDRPREGGRRGFGMRGMGMMGGGMGGGMGRGGMGMLLQVEQVQKEIKLTEDQKAELKKLNDAAREEFRKAMEEFRDLSPEEARQKFQENREKYQQQAQQRAKEMTEKLGQILKPEQMTRLNQIEMQLAGVQVLQRPEVQEKLGLTDDQKSQLKTIQEEMQSKMQELFPRRGDDEGERPSREEMRERMQQAWQKMAELRQETEKKCKAVLTDEQRPKLVELMGEPFELDRSALRGMGPFGGRRGEGRGEGRRGGRRGERNRSEQI